MSSSHSRSGGDPGRKRAHSFSLSDTDLKNKGNQFFHAKKYEEAVGCYTNAIKKNPSVTAYFTNRALCELRLKRYDDAAADCRTALEMEPCSVKGHYFLGQALCELNMLDEGVKHLQRAVDLSKEQRLNVGDEMTNMVRQWRKRRFQLQEEKKIAEEVELQTYLAGLIMEDKEHKIEQIKSQYAEKGDMDEVEMNQEVAQAEKYADKCMTDMNNMFEKIDDLRRKRDVPDYLCGKISFEVLRDPVVTPSGITYERKDIEEHLLRVGHFDPVTRVPLTADQLIPNYAMKEVVDSFLAENEWALDM